MAHMSRQATHSPPSAALSRTSRNFISQRLRLHYVDWGNPDAPPLVLLHGGRDHCRSWDWVAERLAADWHVIAPDLRGHGDSAWSNAGNYMMAGYIYDLAQLIHQQRLAPVTIVAHSLGGNIALRYTGLYPENVARIVAIEGLGPAHLTERARMTVAERTTKWIEETRALAARTARRYSSIEEGVSRMRDVNKRLSAHQARHLTVHGMAQNEDGTFSWKYDPYVRPWAPYDMQPADVQSLWARISCPTLLVCGSESWHTDPAKDGRAAVFARAEVAMFTGAGHWVQHDAFEGFMSRIEAFLSG